VNESVSKQIFDRLDAIAAKLGMAAGHMWPVLVRQVRVDGVRDLSVATALAVATFFLVKLTRWIYKEETDGEVVWLWVGLVAIIVAASGLGYLYSGIGELINPEYYAFTGLKDLFK
jgi:uncharacterized protein involved in response to NO